jgi:SHS2 domain-containing protein
MSDDVNTAFFDFAALPQRSESKRRQRQDEGEKNDSSTLLSRSSEDHTLDDKNNTTKISARKQQKRAGAMTESMSSVTVCDNMDEIEILEKTHCVWDSERLQSLTLHSLTPSASVGLIPPYDKWEYLDHTADVLVHSWGDSAEEAFGQCALALWSHIVDRPFIQYNHGLCLPRIISAFGKDLIDLLFNFLDACLYSYGADYFLCKRIRVTYFGPARMTSSDEACVNDDSSILVDGLLCIRAHCFGELFDVKKHTSHQGTEVKAITYSAMQIFLENGSVLNAGEGVYSDKEVGGGGNDRSGSEGQELNQTSSSDKIDINRPKGDRKGRVDVYVVLDI